MPFPSFPFLQLPLVSSFQRKTKKVPRGIYCKFSASQSKIPPNLLFPTASSFLEHRGVRLLKLSLWQRRPRATTMSPSRLDAFRDKSLGQIRTALPNEADKIVLQRRVIRWAPGCVNPASWFPLAAGDKLTQPKAHLIAQLALDEMR